MIHQSKRPSMLQIGNSALPPLKALDFEVHSIEVPFKRKKERVKQIERNYLPS